MTNQRVIDYSVLYLVSYIKAYTAIDYQSSHLRRGFNSCCGLKQLWNMSFRIMIDSFFFFFFCKTTYTSCSPKTQFEHKKHHLLFSWRQTCRQILLMAGFSDPAYRWCKGQNPIPSRQINAFVLDLFHHDLTGGLQKSCCSWNCWCRRVRTFFSECIWLQWFYH